MTRTLIILFTITPVAIYALIRFWQFCSLLFQQTGIDEWDAELMSWVTLFIILFCFALAIGIKSEKGYWFHERYKGFRRGPSHEGDKSILPNRVGEDQEPAKANKVRKASHPQKRNGFISGSRAAARSKKKHGS